MRISAGLQHPRGPQAALNRGRRPQLQRRERRSAVAGPCCRRCTTGTSSPISGRPPEQAHAGSGGRRASLCRRSATERTICQCMCQRQLAWLPRGVLLLNAVAVRTSRASALERKAACCRALMESGLDRTTLPLQCSSALFGSNSHARTVTCCASQRGVCQPTTGSSMP